MNHISWLIFMFNCLEGLNAKIRHEIALVCETRNDACRCALAIHIYTIADIRKKSTTLFQAQ
jgi:hypothetical protein